MNWQTVAASVIGSSHQRARLPCQDAHEVRLLGNEVVLLAVADGLGSATWAEQGARGAVAAALTVLENVLSSNPPDQLEAWEALLRQAFAAARTALETLAQPPATSLRDYATTLIVAILTPTDVYIGQVGDGAVVAQLADGQLRTLSNPQRGEFANETIPLTAPDALALVCYTHWAEPIQALAAFSDGLQQLCLEATTNLPYAPFFQPLFSQLQVPLDKAEAEPALLDFLQSERISKRADDDKTLVLAGQIMV